jgi:hypothetical protein
MIRLFNITICILSLNLFAQEYIPWGSYYIYDSAFFSPEYDFEQHTSIYPIIYNRNTDYSLNKDKSIFTPQVSVIPMIDMAAGYTLKNFQYRFGFGAATDYIPMRNVHIKLAYVGGLANTNTINYQGGVYPFAVVRKPIANANLFQYHDIRARVSYSPNKYFNFQLGLDNNRFGEGDRSLLLDDYGTPYPFVQTRIKLWRFEYVFMQTYWQNPSNSFYTTRPKFSAMHYLSMNLFQGFNLSFFETVVYDGIIGGQPRGIEWEYLNPMVIYRPLEFALGSTDKVQMGSNASFKFRKLWTIYAQLLIDEFKINKIRERQRDKSNKFAIQFGAKGEKKLNGGVLNYLSEINLVRPFVYSHANPGQAYSNMSNPLAHPLGANFIENSTRLIFRKKRFDYSLDFVYYLRGKDKNDSISWGSDINLSYLDTPLDENNERIMTGFFIGSGYKINATKIHLGIGYLVFPKYRTRTFATLEAFFITQNQSITLYPGFYFGLRTELWNDRRNY